MTNEELTERANGGPWWVEQLASKPEYLTEEGREWFMGVLPPSDYDAEEGYVNGYQAGIEHLIRQAEALSKGQAKLTDDHFAQGFRSGAAASADRLYEYAESDRMGEDAREDFRSQ